MENSIANNITNNMINNVIIREITHEDFHNGLLELYEQHFFIKPEKISENMFSDFLQKKPNEYKIFGFFDNNTIIACATCFIEQKLIHNLGKVGHIEDVIVNTNYRGKNFGRKIIDHCVNYAKQNDCYKIILDCVETNVCFYEKCGFEKKGAFMVLYT